MNAPPPPRVARSLRMPCAIAYFVAALVVGYFLGREHVKRELHQAFSDTVRDVGLISPTRQAAAASDDSEQRARAEKLVILGSKWRIQKEDFNDRFLISMKVRNDNDKAASSVTFHGVLKSPGRAVPWCEGDFFHFPAGGIEPKEIQEWELSLDLYSGNWYNAEKAPPDSTFTVTVKRVELAE